MKLTVVEGSMDDWWTIERENGGRIGGCDVEGSGLEMLALADAIERGENESFKRCAVRRTHDGYELSSPRNSIRAVLITHEEAIALAADIRSKVKAGAA